MGGDALVHNSSLEVRFGGATCFFLFRVRCGWGVSFFFVGRLDKRKTCDSRSRAVSIDRVGLPRQKHARVSSLEQHGAVFFHARLAHAASRSPPIPNKFLLDIFWFLFQLISHLDFVAADGRPGDGAARGHVLAEARAGGGLRGNVGGEHLGRRHFV